MAHKKACRYEPFFVKDPITTLAKYTQIYQIYYI